MKDFIELMNARQSCRDYDGSQVTKEELDKCLEAARLAPSACNSQPWRFVVVTNPELRDKLIAHFQTFNANGWAAKAPVLIAICEEESPHVMRGVFERWGCKRFAEGDVGAAAAMITLEAAELGLGSCLMGMFDNEEAKKLLNVPAGETVRVFVALGRPTDPTVRPKNRKPLAELTRYID